MTPEISSGLINRLREAESVVFFTGAGMSAESGIPTFRGKDGIWNKLKPEELANFNAFMRNPEMVWEWYKYRRSIVHNSQPNEGHKTIAKLQDIIKNVTVVTQNVDNLHRRAGSSSIYELHGNIERNYCIKCRTFYNEDIDIKDKVPKCSCGGLIRPDVVWFGEMLPEDVFEGAETVSARSDIFFVVGTTGIVYPAASMIYIAKRAGAYIVEVNIEETEVSQAADESYYGEAGRILPAIYNELVKQN
jgi:NAD-dependent deacetylase